MVDEKKKTSQVVNNLTSSHGIRLLAAAAAAAHLARTPNLTEQNYRVYDILCDDDDARVGELRVYPPSELGDLIRPTDLSMRMPR